MVLKTGTLSADDFTGWEISYLGGALVAPHHLALLDLYRNENGPFYQFVIYRTEALLGPTNWKNWGWLHQRLRLPSWINKKRDIGPLTWADVNKCIDQFRRRIEARPSRKIPTYDT